MNEERSKIRKINQFSIRNIRRIVRILMCFLVSNTTNNEKIMGKIRQLFDC
ncbi:hypothetical protein F945_01057 [Acinetobacter rudis CIP 110305]|uniref:Transposase n=1 Tax=Acinetobacter rudis CIP 110305 TaxID=421052 RepID=S3NBC5_9GAMM|nr:hypothetical protein F945_01057 [Acinetobacter rudis CIP 110305]